MTLFWLSYRERVKLESYSLEARSADEYRRAQALLWLDDGESVQEVAERLKVSRQSIYNWAMRFEARSDLDLSARLSDAERSGRPRTAHGIIDPLIVEVIDRKPEELGYQSGVWTAPLLSEYLWKFHRIEVSYKSVSFAIERLGIRWKRPRHQLARRPESWRQAKGGSNAG